MNVIDKQKMIVREEVGVNGLIMTLMTIMTVQIISQVLLTLIINFG